MIWTIGEILNYPISAALIADISPRHLRGTYQGIFQTIRALSAVIAPALGGFVLQYLGSTFFWQCCLATGLLIALGYGILGKVRHTYASGRIRCTIESQPAVLPLEVELPIEQ